MKKSLSTILSLAMAFSMFSSVAFGEEAAKSSADFSDLKDLDAATKAKFDEMISAGVFDGVSEGTFGLKDKMNRAQFAKVAALIFKLKVDTSLQTSSFTDVKADDPANGYALPYIEAVKAAGITDGYAPGEYNPAGEVTKEQLATFLIRGLNKDAEAQATPGVSDKTVSDWAKGYVALALQLKLLSSGTDGTFGGTSAATRDLLVLGSYEAKQQYKPEFNGKYAIESFKATDANVLTLQLNGALSEDATKSFKIELKKDGSVISTGYTTTWSEDKTTATLTFDSKFQDNKYDVTISGVSNIDEAASTASVTTTPEKITKIDFLTASDTIPLAVEKVDGSDKVYNIRIDFKATNQYGAQSKLAASNFEIKTSDGTVTPIAGEQAFNLKEEIDQDRNDRISISILHEDSGVQVNKVFTVGDKVMVTKVEVGDLLNSSGNKIDAIEAGGSAYLDTKAYDQYGFVVEEKDYLNDGITVSTSDSDLKVGNDDKDAYVDDVIGTDAADLRLYVDGDEDKDVNVQVFARGGQSVSKTIKIVASKKPATVEFGSYNYTLAEGDKITGDEETDRKFYLPIIVKDANGDQLTPQEIVDAFKTDKFDIDSTSGLGVGDVINNVRQPEISNSGAFKGMIALNSADRKGSQQVTVRLKDHPEVRAQYNVYVGDMREAQEIKQSTQLKKYMITGNKAGNVDNEVKFKFYDQQGSEMKFDSNDEEDYFVKLSYTVNDAVYTAGDSKVDLNKLFLGSKEINPDTKDRKIKLTANKGGSADAYFALMTADQAMAPGVNSWDNWHDKSFKIYDLGSGVTSATVTVKATLYKVDKSGVLTQNTDFAGLLNSSNPPYAVSEVDSNSTVVEIIDPTKSENNLTYEAYFDKQTAGTLLAVQDYTDMDNGSNVNDATYIYNNYKKATGEIKIRAKKNGGEEVKIPTNIVSVSSSNNNVVAIQDKKFAVGLQAGTATLNVVFVNGKGEQQTATLNVTTKNEVPDVQTLSLKKTGKDLSGDTVAKAAIKGDGLYLWDKSLAEKITVKDQYGDEFVGEFGYGGKNEEQNLADQNLIAIKGAVGDSFADKKQLDSLGRPVDGADGIQDNADNNNDLLNLSFYISDVVGGTASEFDAEALKEGKLKLLANSGISAFKVNVNAPNGKTVSFDVTGLSSAE